MLITKLKTVTVALLLIAAVAMGGGLLFRPTKAAARVADECLPAGGEGQQVSQTRTGSVVFNERNFETGFVGGVNSDAGLVGSVVLNERNFGTGFQVGVNSETAPTGFYLVPFVDSGTVASASFPAEVKNAAPKTDLDRFQGVWTAIWYESGGKRYKEKAVFMVDGKRACWQTKDGEIQGGLYLDPISKPKTFDLAMSARTIEGIYSLEGDTLQLCYDPGTEPQRPSRIITEKGGRQVLVVLKRIYGPEAFPFRLPDGTRAFPTLIERPTTPQPPPRNLDQPKDKKRKASDRAAERPARVGKIIVVGNTRTETSVILKTIGLSPGQVLDYHALRAVEKNLAVLHPTVTLLEDNESTDFKMILVRVKE